MISFEDLIALLAKGMAEDVPAFTGIYSDPYNATTPQVWRVTRRGVLARIENPIGYLSLIAGETTFWSRWPVDGVVRAKEREPGQADYELSHFSTEDPVEYWSEWLGQDRALVEGTLRATEHLDRPAWEFIAPWIKGGTPRVTVDAELGLVVEAYRDDVGVFESWTELRTDVDLPDELFTYDGEWPSV